MHNITNEEATANLPETHCAQNVCASVETYPTAQARHVVDPLDGVKVPGAHLWHMVLLF